MRKTFTVLKHNLHSDLRLIFALIAVSMLCFAGQTTAQTVINEGFDIGGPYPNNTLPNGWSQGKFCAPSGIAAYPGGSCADADNYWDRMGAGSLNPATGPRTGLGMVRFRSFYTAINEKSFLASKKLDMTLMPGGGATGSIWMRRSNAYSTSLDSISILANTVPNVTSTAVNIGTALTFTRYNATNGWIQLNFTIPAAGFSGSNSVYVIFMATSRDGDNIYMDDFTVNTYPGPQTFDQFDPNAAIVYSQNTSTTGRNRTNQQIIGCKITVTGLTSPIVLTEMKFNTNGSDNPPTDITRARLWFSGGSNTYNASNAMLIGTWTPNVPSPWATDYTFLTTSTNYVGAASFSGLEHGDNFFWITYDITAGATLGNFVDADWIGFTMDWGFGTTPLVPSIVTFAGKREIQVEYCIPSYGVGTAWAGYQTNDYIHRVITAGDAIPPPGIDNNLNTIYAFAGPLCPAPFPRTCPFQSHPPDYELFPAVPGKTTTYTADGTTVYSISLQVGTYGSGNYIAAWIDYDRDGIFQTTEKIAQSGSLGNLGTYATTFTVPATALPGKTRLRVREVWISGNIDPCATYTYGETEDYEVTIVPECPTTVGYTTWLGFTNDWTDPSNWCPPKAPITANVPTVSVLIPGGPSFVGYTYIRPIIKSGVDAIADTLRIAADDTIYINAPTASSLVVKQHVRLVGASSMLKVTSSLVDTAQVFNGLLNRPTDNPLRNTTRSRSWLMFTRDELISKGIIQGDVVTNLLLHLRRQSNGNPYNNLTVKYYYTNLPSISIGAYPDAPPVFGAPAVPTTIFSGTVNTASFIPTVGDYGTIDLTLIPGSLTLGAAAPIWASAFNRLVLEICYDNVGFPTTGTNDQISFTQTGINNYYLTTQNVSTYSRAGCSMMSADTSLMLEVSGTSSSPVITIDNGNMANIYPGQVLTAGPSYLMWEVEGYRVVSVGPGNQVTLDAIPLWDFFNLDVVFMNTNTTLLYYRPNVTFKFSRPYIQYPISVARDWENNGTFIPGTSRVTFNGTVQQNILGTTVTTFYDKTLNNSANLRLLTDVNVSHNLHLQNGRLKLNNRLLTITDSSLTALTRSSGFIQPETDVTTNNVSPFSRVNWYMGSAPGLRVFPFINAAGINIFMDYNIDSGTHNPIVATYGTAPSNLNIPSPVVTNIFGFNPTTGWSSDGYAMVDRYFMVQQGAGSLTPQADVTFRYSTAERAQIGNTAMSAQGWLTDSTRWEFPYVPGQTFVAASNQLTIENFTNFSQFGWWSIVGTSTPLPVTLLDFTAVPYKDKVQLKWSTGSEVNSSHFEIERTLDNEDFSFIGRVDSRGPSSNRLDYDLWDNNPVEGIQYYYLRQYDINGRKESYGPVSAKFSKDLFEIVTATVSSSEMGITVVFNYDSNKPYSYRIIDMAGRLIVAKDRNPGEPGMNVVEIDAQLAKGAYQIILQNSDKMVTRKFFY